MQIKEDKEIFAAALSLPVDGVGVTCRWSRTFFEYDFSEGGKWSVLLCSASVSAWSRRVWHERRGCNFPTHLTGVEITATTSVVEFHGSVSLEEIVKKFPVHYHVHMSAVDLTLAKHMLSTSSDTMTWRSVLLLSSHPRLNVRSDLFFSGFPIKLT